MVELKSPSSVEEGWEDWDSLLEYTAGRLNMSLMKSKKYSPFVRFVTADGYGDGKEGFSWEDRVQFWARSSDTIFLVYDKERSPLRLYNYAEVRKQQEKVHSIIPIFPGYARKLNLNLNQMIQNLKTVTKKQEKPKMNNFFNKMIDANKDAAVLGAKLTVGKAVNDFLGAKLYKSMPWFTRLFSSKKKATNNAVTKLVAANLVTAAVKIKGGNNEKLNYIAEAMLQDAMVCATRDTEFLNDLISQVENAASVPDSVLEQLKGETK